MIEILKQSLLLSFAHTTRGMGTCIYKYSLSSKNMTVFDYLLPLNLLYSHLSEKLSPSLWITFRFIDRNMLTFQKDEIHFCKTRHSETLR